MAMRVAPSLDELISQPDGPRRAVRRGFVAAIPLWPGDIPFSAVIAIAARSTDFSALETQLLSLAVFAGAAQVTIVSLAASGASTVGIAFTAILLNLRHLLYGMVLRRMMERTSGQGRRWRAACSPTRGSA